MRDIKFRVWDSKNKKWLSAVPSLEYLLNDEDACISHHDIDPESAIYKYPSNILGKDFGGRIVWQQYTGLQDSTGKEIYEGDILAYEEGNFLKGENGLDDRLEIFWDAENAKFGINFYSKYGGEGYTGKGEHLSSYSKKTKIIGNIFETPELLA